MGTRNIKVRIEPEQQGQYFTVPFDLPEKVSCLKVTVQYYPYFEEKLGEWTIREKVNEIDLALIDPKGQLVGASGTSRSQIEISGTTATPGYRAGPIKAGTWRILIGAYHVAPEGVTATYTISWSEKKKQWYRGDLHTHTLMSDGVLAPNELAVQARRHGLDFIAITDHNTMLSKEALPSVEGLSIIPGLEWTHYKGHANLLGVDHPYQGSYHANTFDEVKDHFDQAKEKGALIVICHPCDPPFRFQYDIERLPHDVIEIWNGPMRESNLDAIALWHQMLVSGKKIAACCGSDYHKNTLFQFLGGPCLYVLSDSNEGEDLLTAIKEGHSFMGFAPDGPTLDMKAGSAVIGDFIPWQADSTVSIELDGLLPGDCVRLIHQKGILETIPVEKPGRLQAIRHIPEPGFVRLELDRLFIPGMPALPGLLSNPIYFD